MSNKHGLFYKSESLKTSMEEKKNRAKDAMSTLVVQGVIGAIKLAAVVMDKVNWWPNKAAAEGYFRKGHLYRSTNKQIWCTLWADREMTKQLMRIKPGIVFMVLDFKVMFPKGILLHVLQNETPGWILIDGSEQYAPWTRLELV